MSHPTQTYLIAAKRILRYVKGSLHHGISLCRSNDPLCLWGYSDADWAGCLLSGHSLFHFILIFHGPNLISWSSTKQPTVSRSSAESKYHALAHACDESIWLSYVLREFRFPITLPMFFFVIISVLITWLPILSFARMKHIELDYNFFHEWVKLGTHKVHFIPSIDQFVDVLTKELSKSRFDYLRSKRVTPKLPSFRGAVSVGSWAWFCKSLSILDYLYSKSIELYIFVSL